MRRPLPPHVGHAAVRTNSPKTLRVTCCTWPDARARLARDDVRPRLRAAAPAARARDRDLERHVALDTRRRLDQLDLDDRAQIGAAGPARPSAEQVVAEERAEEIRQRAEVEVAGLETAAAQARVAVAVVQLARLRLRQHLVRLDDLLEALLRVGRIRDVRVQLAGEPAERPLDLGLARAAFEAEQLVVVPLRRRHQSSKTASENRDSSCAADRTARSALS
jgi:hypothetical protein